MMSSARWLLQAEKLAMQRIGARSIAPAQMALRSAFADPQVAGRTAYTATRAYHSTALAMAKAKKSGGGKKGGDEEEVEATLPDLSHTRKKMEMVVDRFSQEMAKVKVGRASVDMFSDIQVGSYGSVSSAGQVTVKTASSINIAVYDPSMVKTVADAIKDCGMGFSPTVENSNITVFVPKPSKESRDVLIKAASRSAEKSKLDIRQLRKLVLDDVKKIKGAVSADDSKRFTKEVETTTEKHVEKIAQLMTAKEKEILAA